MTPAEFRAARKSLGLTQTQAAAMLGYGQHSRISDIETGKHAAPATTVRLLRAYLDGYRPADWQGKEDGQ